MKHPFLYYIDLIENGRLSMLIYEFDHPQYVILPYRERYGDFCHVEWIKQKGHYEVSIFDQFEEPQEFILDLPLFLKTNFDQQEKEIRNIIRNQLLSRLDMNSLEFCKRLQQQLIYLIKASQSLKTDIKYKIEIINSLNRINQFLIPFTKTSYIAINSSTLNKKNKIKWLGNVSTLATLFYDLSDNTNNLGKKMIEYDRSAITDFIIENFMDTNKENFDRSTVYRYLNSNVTDGKKSKNRFKFKGEPVAEDPH